MPKKAKKAKKQKSSKSSSDPIIPPEKTNEFLLAVQYRDLIRIESTKQSILFYRYEYTKMYWFLTRKEELRDARDRHAKISSLTFDNVKERLNHIDKLGNRELEMQNLDSVSRKEMESIKKQGEVTNAMILNELYDRIEYLETCIDKKNQDLQSISEFKMIPQETLDKERQELVDILEAMKNRHRAITTKLIKRHDAIVTNSNFRMKSIITAADSSAVNKEFERFTDDSLFQERQNKILKKQIELLLMDSKTLVKTIEELEQQHFKLVQQNVEIDCEFKYEQDSLPPLPLPKLSTISTRNESIDTLAQRIIQLEITKRNETMTIYGQKATLGLPSQMGCTKYYGSLVDSIN